MEDEKQNEWANYGKEENTYKPCKEEEKFRKLWMCF